MKKYFAVQQRANEFTGEDSDLWAIYDARTLENWGVWIGRVDNPDCWSVSDSIRYEIASAIYKIGGYIKRILSDSPKDEDEDTIAKKIAEVINTYFIKDDKSPLTKKEIANVCRIVSEFGMGKDSPVHLNGHTEKDYYNNFFVPLLEIKYGEHFNVSYWESQYSQDNAYFVYPDSAKTDIKEIRDAYFNDGRVYECDSTPAESWDDVKWDNEIYVIYSTFFGRDEEQQIKQVIANEIGCTPQEVELEFADE